ncbi:MAG: hypothetical protein Q8R04_06240 [Nanoarchaeota archaeon]|nr:hypothetical protein [Nanoarchaeota archaeon]
MKKNKRNEVIKQFEELKKERIEDDKKRDKYRKFFGFFNKLVMMETIIGLVIALIIYIFFIRKLQ